MKKYKILLIIVLAFILTGCTANYETKIMLDGSIKESINTNTFGYEIFKEEQYTKDALKKATESYLKLSQIKAKNIIYKDDGVKVYVTNSYQNIKEFSNNSKAINTIFDSLQVLEKKNKVSLKTIKSEYDFGIEEYFGSTITISLPYKVLNNNANEYNSKDNTYLWKIDSNFQGIELEYQTNRFYTYNFIKLFKYASINTYIILVVTILLIIFGIIVIIYYYRAIRTMRL